MSQADFDLLISLFGPRISKQNTNYRECIPAEMRLAITLRFLATGDSIVTSCIYFEFPGH
nr:unnamed protein product [Callosobruchus chinensis]